MAKNVAFLPKCVFSQKEVGSLNMINYLLISIVGSFMFASCSHNKVPDLWLDNLSKNSFSLV